MKQQRKRKISKADTPSICSFVRRSIVFLTSTGTLVCFLVGYIIGGGFLFVYLEQATEIQTLKNSSISVSKLRNAFISSINKENEESVNVVKNTVKHAILKIDSIINEPMPLKDTTANVSAIRGRSMKEENLHKKLNDIKDMIVQFKTDMNGASPYINDINGRTGPFNSVNHSTTKFIQDIYTQTRAGYQHNFNESKTIKWTFPAAILYSVTVLTTIGYGNIVPSTFEGKMATIVYAMFGIPILLLCLANLGSHLAKLLTVLYSCCTVMCRCRKSQPEQNPKSSYPLTRGRSMSRSMSLPGNKLTGRNLLLLSSDSTNLTKITESSMNSDTKLNFTITIKTDDFMKNLDKKDSVKLPLYIPFILFVIYFLLGAWLMKQWEGWYYSDSCYFVFITLSTIGFGDMVPGFNKSQWTNQFKPIFCAIYLLFGLVLLSMCFQLIQDMLRFRAKRLGKHIGLVKSNVKA